MPATAANPLTISAAQAQSIFGRIQLAVDNPKIRFVGAVDVHALCAYARSLNIISLSVLADRVEASVPESRQYPKDIVTQFMARIAEAEEAAEQVDTDPLAGALAAIAPAPKPVKRDQAPDVEGPDGGDDEDGPEDGIPDDENLEALNKAQPKAPVSLRPIERQEVDNPMGLTPMCLATLKKTFKPAAGDMVAQIRDFVSKGGLVTSIAGVGSVNAQKIADYLSAEKQTTVGETAPPA